MSKIALDKMFSHFNDINSDLEYSNILEISVKQHQIAIWLDNPDKLFYLSDSLQLVHDVIVTPQTSYITTLNDNMYVIIEDIPDDFDNDSSKFNIFMKVIRYLADHVCTCPALEYVISDKYIKCYLDKPGLKLDDIRKIEELFGETCTLELTTNRPYALFINAQDL